MAERTLDTNRARPAPGWSRSSAGTRRSWRSPPRGSTPTASTALTVGGVGGRPLKATTVQRDLTNLSGILARALKLGWIESNPYVDAEKVKYVPSGDFNVLTRAGARGRRKAPEGR